VGWLVGEWGQIRVAALKRDEYGTVCDACNPGRKQTCHPLVGINFLM
jgi:hypothetical protein